MDYLYSVELGSYLSDDEIKLSDTSLASSCQCSLSNKNILAIANDCCVYLLPLEKPNELIPVTLATSPSTHLVWSDDGQHLLNVHANGVCNLFAIRANCLNSVELVYTFQLEESNLAAIKAFSKSPKVCTLLKRMLLYIIHIVKNLFL